MKTFLYLQLIVMNPWWFYQALSITSSKRLKKLTNCYNCESFSKYRWTYIEISIKQRLEVPETFVQSTAHQHSHALYSVTIRATFQQKCKGLLAVDCTRTLRTIRQYCVNVTYLPTLEVNMMCTDRFQAKWRRTVKLVLRERIKDNGWTVNLAANQVKKSNEGHHSILTVTVK